MSNKDFWAAVDASTGSYVRFEAENIVCCRYGSGSSLLAFGVSDGVYVTAKAGHKTVGITISAEDANRLAQQLIREIAGQ